MMQLDHKYQVWHPYTQMKGAEIIPIVRGEGARLYSSNGDEFIDAISSWWTNIHGHAHPYIAEAIYKQASTLEQTIFAGFSHEPAIRLADKLLKHIPYHHKLFYTDNGSTAVEVALKMALQFWRNQEDKKTKIICFKDAYHGDTFGAMSMSGRGLFTHAFQSLLFDVIFIDTPTYSNEAAIIEQFNNRLQSAEKEEIAAFILNL
jgi:adenosylmethionine-8-amino-7-oxononanoate aminotransferase